MDYLGVPQFPHLSNEDFTPFPSVQMLLQDLPRLDVMKVNPVLLQAVGTGRGPENVKINGSFSVRKA